MDRSVAISLGLIALLCGLGVARVVPVSLHMLLITAALIYVGSRFALKCWKLDGSAHGGEDESGVERHRAGGEQMATRDAMMFPIIGSCVLFSLYCVYKLLPKDYVNILIKTYFFIFGVLVLAQKLAQILTATLPVARVHALLRIERRVPNPSWLLARAEEKLMPVLKRVPFLGYNDAPAEGAGGEEQEAPPEFWLPLSAVDLISLALGAAVGVWYLATGSWLASNMFGMAFSVQGIEMLSLGAFVNGVILLSGLFVYDVWWVFGTEVMVTVARSFDAPIKLLFPQFLSHTQPSMLGLGDIVIPGIFLALLLRFDIWRNMQRIKAEAAAAGRVLSKSELHDLECLYCHAEKQPSVPYPYFRANLIAYVAGLGTTVGVMYAFQAAQPALLYLVPACLGTALVQAMMRGEINVLWNYKENEEEEAEKEKKEKETKEKKEAKAESSASAEESDKGGEQPAAGDSAQSEGVTKRVTRQTSSKKKRSVRAD